MDTLRLFTLDHPVEVDPGVGISRGFTLLRLTHHDCSINYTGGTQSDRPFNCSFSECQHSPLLTPFA